jgi:hypothetical protein
MQMPRVDPSPTPPQQPGERARAPTAGRAPGGGEAPGERFLAALTAQRAGSGGRNPSTGLPRPPPRDRETGGPPADAGRAIPAARGGGRRARAVSGRAAAEDAGSPSAAASLLAPWQIGEGPPRAPPRARAAAAIRAPTTAAERLLLGFGPAGGEARLRIGHGPLSGAEIHLRHLPGGIEAVVLTRAESSRQTLAVAMEEVARRLHRKGYTFRTRDAAAPPSGGQPPAAGRGRL